MLRCKDLVHLVGRSTAELSLKQRLEVKVHLLMCRHCSKYVANLEALKVASRRLFEKKTAVRPDEIERIEKEILKKIVK